MVNCLEHSRIQGLMFVCVLLKETTRGKTVISQGMTEEASVKRLLNGSKYIYQQM